MMNGLEVSEKIKKFSIEIETLNKILMKVESDRDYRSEVNIVRGIVSQMEKEREVLQNKLHSVNF